jgi:Domain of unknown function (DUF4440)
MKRFFAASLLAGTTVMAVGLSAADRQAPTPQVQQQLIALDKQWGESAGNKATLDKILADNMLSVGPEGEGGGKKEQIESQVSAGTSNYVADEFKFETLTPDIIVMTHRGTSTEMQGGKSVKESHRSLHVFQRKNGNWQVVASGQTPIAKP